MAILSSGFPFKLSFKLSSYNYENSLDVSTFFETDQELYENTNIVSIEIKENIPLEVIFQSEYENAKFYMDGLDSLPERFIEIEKDGGEAYLPPSPSSIILYRNNRDEFYPYIPGLYRIRINVAEKLYFAWLKVLPKQINEHQWEDMRDEVEQELRGLAQDLVRKSYGLSHEKVSKLSPTILRQFMVIDNRFPAIMAAINDLYRKINFKLKKEYMFVPQEKSSVIDEITIRYRVMHPETNKIVKTPLKKINYNLPENRLAKRIIQSLIGKLSNFLLSVELYKDELTKEVEDMSSSYYDQKYQIQRKKQIIEQLEVYSEKAKKMRGMLNWAKTAPWYKEISDSRDISIPHVMTTDVRYRTLYQVQRELQKETLEIKFDKLFTYQWKRTDKLYEIWGFLQFIKILQQEEVGFSAQSGWIYDDKLNLDQIIIPTMPKETTITFKKDDLTLKLIYEGKLPSRSNETNPNFRPLYTTGTNNCPDGRIDIYKDTVFIGSLIFDFKYRPKSSIWMPSRISNNAHTTTMRQLVSYAFNCRSEHLFGNKLNQYLRDTLRPVPEVWAIYPNLQESTSSLYYRDHNVRLVELSPSFNNMHLATEINQIIEYMVHRSNQFV